MLELRDSFFQKNSRFKGIGICGEYIPNRDAIHVGLFWSWEDDNSIIHFLNTNTIELLDLNNPKFSKYYFIQLSSFPSGFIDSIGALSQLIVSNSNPRLYIQIYNAVYNNGKFDIQSGAFIVNNDSERFVNCAIFVLALLNTYDFPLLNIDSWPSLTDASKRTYLEDWLNYQSIAKDDRSAYTKHNKEIRGKHVISAPMCELSATYSDAEKQSQDVLNLLKELHKI